MSVRKKDGRYLATVEVGQIGERKRKTKLFDKVKDAKRWEREMMEKAELLDMDEYDITIKALGDRFLESKKKKGVAAGTYGKYRNILRIINDSKFAQKKARDIRKNEVESFLSSLAFDNGLTLNYIKEIKSVLSSTFKFGIENDIILKNPAISADLPNIKQKPSSKDSFTPREIAAIKKHYMNIPFGDIVYILINTGLRSQEICALSKDNLIEKDGQPFIRIDNAMKRTLTGNWTMGDTKSQSSKRDIPIDAEIKTLILKRIMTNESQLLLPGGRVNEVISYTNFRKHYMEFLEALNEISPIRPLPPHCCRHTFSSRLEWAGVSPFTIKDLMGHAKVDMTNNYTHTIDEKKIEAIEILKIS